ncbi:MAG: HDIG domain-containing protein [Chloroflexi bacterium]|nr:MAG: HDIG domain-containing protein [Chloroflexota bacterium]
MDKTTETHNRWQQLAQSSVLWLFAFILTIGLTLILATNLTSTSNIFVIEGQPAPDDIFAPRSLTYTSNVRTQELRDQASASVAEVYTPLDLNIGRTQLARARAVFAFIETVRADTQATTETKLKYLQAIEGLTIEEQVGLDLLSLTPSEYQTAKEETLTIIDELMREDIRESQVSDFQRIARRQASLELSPAQNNVVTSLAPQFIVPTVFPDEQATAQKREEAAAAVQPVVRTIKKDQRIIRAGDIVTPEDIELLTQLGLLQREPDWRDNARIFLAALLASILITLYWYKFHNQRRKQNARLATLGGLILVFMLGARLILASNAGLLPYLFPIAAMSMLLAVVFEVRLALVVTTVVAALYGYAAPNSLELAMYTAAGGILAILSLHDEQRMTSFFRAGMIAALGHMVVILMFHLSPDADLLNLLQLILYAIGNGVLSAALTLVGFFVLGGLFGITTTLQLQDLSRLDHPLLQELLRRAPGTYHHSIMVANLAEQAAEQVKANSTLVRVGAFYHDIGKMNRPPFFTENQEGVNPHDSLDPYSSARIIISHVSDGLELARRYRLPDDIRDFIAEHHGDRVVKAFYRKAVEQSGGDESKVDVEKFRHRGPRPQSRETGIVMLADAIEATSSALRPDTEKAIEKLVNSIVDEHLAEGQLDESGLTLGDIKLIRMSFIKTLKGRFHVRVKYPGNESLADEGAEGEMKGTESGRLSGERQQGATSPVLSSTDVSG